MNLAPDSHRYLAMGRGERAYKPFHRRILFPYICKDVQWRWRILTEISLVYLPLLVGLYLWLNGLSWQAVLFGVVIMAGMPSMRFWYKTPVLVDAPAICLAISAAVLPPPYNYITVGVGGLASEKVPIFAALYAWDPTLLFVGAIPLVLIEFFIKPGKTDQMSREESLDHPFLTAQRFKAGAWFNPDLMLWPMGVALTSLFYPTWQLMATIVVAYAQLFVATDYARLYVWAVPVMALQAGMVGIEWMIPLAALHLFNPRAGGGA